MTGPRRNVPTSQSAPLPVVMLSETCAWRAQAITSLNAYKGSWEATCEASTLVSMTTAIVAETGIGLLLSTMNPEVCVSLYDGHGPEKIDVEFGVFIKARKVDSMLEFVGALTSHDPSQLLTLDCHLRVDA